ncbi:hypothetical protein [Epilithonimonas sp. UC225_85]|uniref:hypothetical protein n=1 Tax=Epilithonimonas sp. UC225_85 TaxID=3350167 RepID=UPI0036D30629
MKKLLLLVVLMFTTITFAQNQLNFEFGTFDFLKDQTEVNVQLKFENVLFQAENYTEAQYLERRKTETLAKKNAAAWQKWIDAWQNYKDTEYLNYFLKGVNGWSKKVVFKKDVKAKYTLIIDTKWVYAGWHAGLVAQEGKLTSDLIFVETDNPSKVIMKLQGAEVLGKQSNKDFTMEYGRIAAAYEVTGKLVGKALRKVVK